MRIQSLLHSAVALGLCVTASSTPTLSQLIASNDNLSQLGALLGNVPYVEKLVAAAGNVTIFAPSNDAFKAYKNTGLGKSSNSSDFVLQLVLEYHVLSSTIYSSQITATPAFPATLLKDGNREQQVVEVSLDDGTVVVTSGLQEQSKVIQADLNFTNGVVHVIDKVLTTPANVLEVGLIGGLDDFVGALFKTNVSTKLETGANYTFFAPTNQAFQAIGSAAAKLSTQELAEILEYHVLDGVVYSTDLKTESVATLNGKDVKVTVEKDGAVFVNAARIINANVLVGEGVLHVIDSVLNPSNSSAQPDPSAKAPAIQFSGASSAGLAALTATLPTVSTHASALTATTAPSAALSSASGSGGTTPTAASATSTMSPVANVAGAIPTAAVGALALFGGAAWLVNW